MLKKLKLFFWQENYADVNNKYSNKTLYICLKNKKNIIKFNLIALKDNF